MQKEGEYMSMNTSIVYGYGFRLTYTPNSFKRWLILHQDSFKQTDKEIYLLEQMTELDEHILDYNCLDLLFSDYYSEISTHCGPGAAIANIMSRETHIRFEYQPGQDDCGGEPHIMLTIGMPWHFNQIEKDCSEDRLDKILEKYINELGLDEIPHEVALEYYG